MPVSLKRQLNRSTELQRRAEKFLPGGVDSPVRAFRAVGGNPPFAVKGEGAYLWDADGNRYLDYFGSWGPMILGHAFPSVVEAIQKAAANSDVEPAALPRNGSLPIAANSECNSRNRHCEVPLQAGIGIMPHGINRHFQGLARLPPKGRSGANALMPTGRSA